MFHLRPSEIYFSQDRINNHFDKNSEHAYRNVGKTLDDLVEGRCWVQDIPTVNVIKRGSQWVTADNRRLWVFRHLEKLGKCNTIPVNQVYFINPNKLNSTTGGRTVRFYIGKSATGKWHSKVGSIDPDLSSSLPLQSRPVSSISPSSDHFSIRESPSPLGSRHDDVLFKTRTVMPSLTMFKDFNCNRLPQEHTDPSTLSHKAVLVKYLSLSQETNRFDPSDIRYTKETIQIGNFFRCLSSTLRFDSSQIKQVDAIIVYKAFNKNWVTDGNKRLWAFKEARKFNQNIRIPVVVKENKDEFLDIMRKDRPWLSLIDIMQSGTDIDVCF